MQDDSDLVYYDASQRSPPDSLQAYCEADHVIMSQGGLVETQVDRDLAERGLSRRTFASLPSFASVASVLRGSDLIALMPAKLKHTSFEGLATTAPPYNLTKSTIAAIWHLRSDTSKRHKWMRQKIAIQK